ncbi:5'-3' exonuclease PLD3 isoform 2-T2 [Pholidichthys leucotaenia]
MPMVLRSRKAVLPGQEGQVEFLQTTPRRTGRRHGTVTYEELKHCSIVLERLPAPKKETEEREDMNRKGGKPASRIPTFQKRPTSASQNSELPPKKDSAVHVAQPPDKVESRPVEASKSKLPDIREKALPPSSAHTLKIVSEAPSVHAAAVHCLPPAAPKSFLESVKSPLMSVSPRPALRAEQDKSRTSEAMPESSVSSLPHEHSLSQKPWEEMAIMYDTEVTAGVTPTASGDSESSVTKVSQVEAIMDEEPPWKAGQMIVAEKNDSISSSEAECEDDYEDERFESHDLGDVKECQEPLVRELELPKMAEKRADVDSSSPLSPEKSAKVTSEKSAKRSGCSSFTFFCFLPTTLLLLGGFSQHVWQYGLPMSVSQLTAQLELHWLEGFGLVPEPCSTDCRVNLVESIPVGLYQSSSSSRQSIADSWLHLLKRANSSVHIAAFYFTLRASDLGLTEHSDSQGQKVFEELKQLESKGVALQIAVNAPQTSTQDTAELASKGAEVREVNLGAVTGGIIHTKLWVVDQKHFYLGSANMDWRSLSQVKEVGLSVEDCSCLAQDAFRIFGVYWTIGGLNSSSLPPYWPARLSALSSSQKPMHLKFNGVPSQVYLSSAPAQISARGRSDDLLTILSVIDDAQKFVYISVMDYLPLSEFTEPVRFWPDIDSALRAAACTRRVQVRLMVSCWKHSPTSMFTFLQSLLVLSRSPLKCDIDVKIFTVPSTPEQMKIPFARVNHAKYMVTDRVVYIGTSNWSENYFTQTAGVGLVVNQTDSVAAPDQQTLQRQAEELFLRDWRSAYSSTLSVDDVDICSHTQH